MKPLDNINEINQKTTEPDLSDEFLVLKAQNGSEQSFNILVNRYYPLIRKKAYGFLSADNDDLIQEGRIGLWKCISKFDKTSGANFLTYAKPAIRNAMLDFIRKCPTAEVCLDDFIGNEERLLLSELISDPYSKSPEQIVINAETIKEMYEALHCWVMAVAEEKVRERIIDAIRAEEGEF